MGRPGWELLALLDLGGLAACDQVTSEPFSCFIPLLVFAFFVLLMSMATRSSPYAQVLRPSLRSFRA